MYPQDRASHSGLRLRGSVRIMLVKRPPPPQQRRPLALVLALSAISPNRRCRQCPAMTRPPRPLARDRLALLVHIALAFLQELHDDRERRPARDRPTDADERDKDSRLPDLGHEERRKGEEGKE